MTAWDDAFALTIGNEGGLSTDRGDPGNWTGGKVGAGTFKGSKYGISAASFPTLDIASLTLSQAKAIAFVAYWLKAACDKLPPALAILVFDSAYNNGVHEALCLLQAALGCKQDGLFGLASVAALGAAVRLGGVASVCAAFADERLWFMTGLSDWDRDRGWCRRLASIPFAPAVLAALTTNDNTAARAA